MSRKSGNRFSDKDMRKSSACPGKVGTGFPIRTCGKAGGEQDLRRELFFDHALLPSGWARDVRITVADGSIAAVAAGAPRTAADRIAGIAVPGIPNLHCHAFQRGMAGLAERPGPSD